ncbi:MAG: hypothetical protein MI924_18160 [Chloroflexales bacterium]|nr:hypothetical protein [Chloroflexales bacterium]
MRATTRLACAGGALGMARPQQRVDGAPPVCTPVNTVQHQRLVRYVAGHLLVHRLCTVHQRHPIADVSPLPPRCPLGQFADDVRFPHQCGPHFLLDRRGQPGRQHIRRGQRGGGDRSGRSPPPRAVWSASGLCPAGAAFGSAIGTPVPSD